MTSSESKKADVLATIASALAAKRLRLTAPRLAVVDCLMDGKHVHTVDEIRAHLAKRGVRANVKSVYATLEMLKGFNFVHDYLVAGKHRFELTVGSEDHIHIYDDKEAIVQVIPIDENLRSALKRTAALADVAIKDVQIVIHAKEKNNG